VSYEKNGSRASAEYIETPCRIWSCGFFMEFAKSQAARISEKCAAFIFTLDECSAYKPWALCPP